MLGTILLIREQGEPMGGCPVLGELMSQWEETEAGGGERSGENRAQSREEGLDLRGGGQIPPCLAGTWESIEMSYIKTPANAEILRRDHAGSLRTPGMPVQKRAVRGGQREGAETMGPEPMGPF